MLFKVVADLLNRHGTRVSWSMGVTASRGERPHGKPDEIDQGPARSVAALREALDLSWWDGARPIGARFEAFRALDADMKARIVGVAMADAIAPSEMSHGEKLLAHVARQVVPDLRAVWRPTGEAFFGRIRKARLLHLLATDLRQPEEAARLAAGKKADIVDHLERLFAAPFATLTPAQREAVETWCPPGTAIEPAPDAAPMPAEDAAPDDTGEADGGFDEDEAFEVDPDETFGADEEFGTELDDVDPDPQETAAPEPEVA